MPREMLAFKNKAVRILGISLGLVMFAIGFGMAASNSSILFGIVLIIGGAAAIEYSVR